MNHSDFAPLLGRTLVRDVLPNNRVRVQSLIAPWARRTLDRSSPAPGLITLIIPQRGVESHQR